MVNAMRTSKCNSLVERLEHRRLLATYYVATTGSNSANGSQGSPWATLQFAADRVAAGDTVLVAPGGYVGFDLRTSGTASQRITFKAQSSGVVIDRVNTRTNRDGINVENASYVTIDSFTLVGTNNPNTSRAGIRVVGDGFDTGVFSSHVIVQNNNCDRWGVWGIFTAFADDIIIQRNVCSRSAQQHGIYFSNSADRPIIRNNTCWGNANCGIHMNADIETGNTSLPNVDGIITGALVDGNTCYSNGGGSAFGPGGGSAINCDGVRDSRFVNNVLYDNHATGIALYQIDAAAPAVNNVVANNTVIMAADSRWCLLITDGAVNTTVFNNIFYNLHSTHGAIELSADSTTGLRSDYNFVEDRFSHSDNFVSLAQWRTLTGGQDAHSRTITQAQMQALFTNYAGNDFTLSSTSAAANAGATGLTSALGTFRAAPNNDRNNNVRPALGGGGFDVGAYERPVAIAVREGDWIVVQGTIGDDVISIAPVSGANLLISRNGGSVTLSSAGVVGIRVFGYEGADKITIQPDVIIGASINSGNGNDIVHGGGGADTIQAGAGRDRVYAGAGNDRLYGSSGNDILFGESGKDLLYGGDGDDSLDGGSHSDRLYGEAGHNTLLGQAGDDTLYSRNASADILDGGGGTDRAQVDDNAMDSVTLVEELFN